MSPDLSAPHRVLVAGAGVAGLEALLALRELAGERVELTLLTPEREWWPPPKVTGRYLGPYLAALEEAEYTDAERPQGQLVEFTMEGHGR